MYFASPVFLLLVLLIFLPFLFPKVRRALPIPSSLLIKERTTARILRLFFSLVSILFWTAGVILAVIIIAWPLEDHPHFLRMERVRKICAVADVSTSMSGVGIERSKKILHEFVDRRKGDWLCLVAYSGASGQEGGARVLQPLTPDLALMHQAVDRLEAKLLGSHTAIGEGIWVTVFALREKQIQTLEKKNVLLDLGRLRYELKKGEQRYAEYLVNLLGRYDNEIMVFFTDGYYNTGLHPSFGISLAKRLGMRMYISVLEATGATGLSQEVAQKRLEELKRAAKETGGDFFKGQDYDEIAAFYRKVDQIEKRDMVVETKSLTRELYPDFARVLPFVLFSFIVTRVIFIQIRGKRRTR